MRSTIFDMRVTAHPFHCAEIPRGGSLGQPRRLPASSTISRSVSHVTCTTSKTALHSGSRHWATIRETVSTTPRERLITPLRISLRYTEYVPQATRFAQTRADGEPFRGFKHPNAAAFGASRERSRVARAKEERLTHEAVRDARTHARARRNPRRDPCALRQVRR